MVQNSSNNRYSGFYILKRLTHWFGAAESSHKHRDRVNMVFRELPNSTEPMIIAVFIKFSKINLLRASQKLLISV